MIYKNSKFNFSLLFATLLLLGFSSCSDDDSDPEVINEEEVITTITVNLSSTAGDVTLQSQDLDGDGPNPPVITVSDVLTTNTTYTGSIVLLNETDTPAEDITVEVKEEDEDHQFIFVSTGAIDTIAYADQDSDGNPVGIEFTLTTGDAGTGSVQITLRHLPKKPNDGTLTDAGGETDISQLFNVTIE